MNGSPSGCRFFWNSDLKIHPATQIIIWMVLVLQAQYWSVPALMLASLATVSISLWLDSGQLQRLLLRIKWIALTILVIYAFTTPGVAWVESAGLFSPTREGVEEGLLQLGRLLCAISGLAILLSILSREQFVEGVYSLSWPLRLFGFSRARLATRLALTLSYAEESLRATASDWRQAIDESMQVRERAPEVIELPLQSPGWLDMLLLVAVLGMGVWS